MRPAAWLLALAATAIVFIAGGSVLGWLGLAFLAVKLILSKRSHHGVGTTAASSIDGLRVAVIVPLYNEDPEIVRRTIRSILAQSRMPDSVHVVDDGSRSTDAIDAVAHECGRAGARVLITRHAQNRGKREAIATAARAEEKAQIFVTVDSDTVLEPDAVAEPLKVFRDRVVFGATALVSVLNRRRNILTRLIDLRYANAFLLDRGFQSAFGSVLCACGSLAAWRRSVIVDNLDDFLDQRFLGARCTYGDDRRLTNYALTSGRVVLVSEARAHTAVPERLSHYVRQQVRWTRSFIRESLWAIMHLPISRPGFWLSLAEFTAWFAFSITVVVAVVVLPALGARVTLATMLFYACVTATLAWIRSIRWFDLQRSEDSRRERWLTFSIAPLYAVLHIIVLIPLRIAALLTLRATAWGTRDRGVEVSLAAPEGLEPGSSPVGLDGSDVTAARHRIPASGAGPAPRTGRTGANGSRRKWPLSLLS